MVQKLFQGLKDVLKAVALGALIAAALGLLFFLGGFLFGGMQLAQGFEVMKDGLLVITGLGMLVVAGMLLLKGKKPEKIRKDDAWRRHFKVIGIKTMLLCACLGVLLVAAIADYGLRMIGA